MAAPWLSCLLCCHERGILHLVSLLQWGHQGASATDVVISTEGVESRAAQSIDKDRIHGEHCQKEIKAGNMMRGRWLQEQLLRAACEVKKQKRSPKREGSYLGLGSFSTLVILMIALS